MRRAAAVAVLAAVAFMACFSLFPGDADASGYESHDAVYEYSTWGSGSDSSPYGCTLNGVSGASGILRLPAALEGYPLRTVESVGVCGADVLVVPATVRTVSDGAFSGSSVGELIFLGDRPDWNAPADIAVTVLEGTSGWGSEETLPRGIHDGGGCSFSYVVIDSCAEVLSWISGKDIVIPGELGGCPVTRIADTAFMDSPIESAVIPQGVSCIGVRAFYGCDRMVSAPIPDSVRILSDEAFRFCPLMESADLDGAEFIGFETFRQCYALDELVVPESVEEIRDGAFYICRGVRTVDVKCDMPEIPGRSFGYMDALERISFPAPPVSVGQSAFYNCPSLTQIDLTAAEYVGDYAFRGCKYLSQTGDLGNVRCLGNGAFSECRSLESMVLGPSLEKVGIGAFDGCRSLEDLYFTGPMPEMGADAVPGDTAVHCLPGHEDSWAGYDGLLVVDDGEEPAEPEEGESFPWGIALAAVLAIAAVSAVALHCRRSG